MPKELNCLPREPGGVPGRKPPGAPLCREFPEKDEGVSGSTEPLARWPRGKGLSAPLWGRSWAALSSPPQLLSPPRLWEGLDHLLWDRSPQGGRKARGFHTAPFRNHHPPKILFSWGRCPFCSLGLFSPWQAGNTK